MAGALPLLGESPRERRDAARNRDALLHAAQEMVQNGGVDCVTMDRVAEAAGVGKGTVFRRFESRAGLMAALVNALEMDWQEAVISGPAPLGPGAPPLDRLLAMGRSRMDLNLTHAELPKFVRALQDGGEMVIRDRIFEGWADLVRRVVGPENS